MKFEERVSKILDKFDQWRIYIGPGIIVLGLIVFATLVYSIGVMIFSSNNLNVLPAISISAGVLIAILTFAREHKKNEEERERNSSKVFLERAIVGFDVVYDLLSDKNNNRIIWVHAARTLLQAIELGNQIKNNEYKKAFQLYAEQTRVKLYQALSFGHAGASLPPNFFYGSSNWEEESLEKISLNDAARKVSNKIEVIRGSIDFVSSMPEFLPLSEKSVIAIYNFLEFPDDYSDPLESVKDWDSEWYTLKIDQGARSYVAHRKMKFTSDGKLYDRKLDETDS